jgi:hypothetical protein
VKKAYFALSSALTVASIALADPAAAQVTAVNGKIAYTVCDYNNPPGDITCDIWVMDPDGTNQTNLTSTPELNETQPAWSPDGTRIAYLDGVTYFYTIKVMNADGTGKAPIVPTPSYQFGPTWSADGAQIAFTRMTTGQVITTEFDIFVINVDGTGETNLTNSDYDELGPAWSPDGTKIAFAGVRPEMMSDGSLAAGYEIVTVNPDGTGEQILTAGIPGTPRGDSLEDDRAPAWSPDGALLVYMTQSVDPCCPPWQLEKVDRDGTNIVLLSDNPLVDDMFPSFSPDGTLIIFVSDRGPGGELGFYTMPAPAPGPAAPTAPNAIIPIPTPANASDPAWGRKPAVYAAQGIKVDVHGAGGLSNLNGVLEAGESVILEPAWRNLLTSPQTFTGIASAVTGPPGPVYTLDDALADYGSVGAGATADCYNATPAHDCYQVSITGTRPAAHWDATFDEALGSGLAGFAGTWTLHVGESFPDVPTSNPFYFHVENLFHNGITGGCGGGGYCPTTPVTRGQMAVFLLKAEHGSSHTPPSCFPGIFLDVSCPGPFADWIDELFQEGITGGCGPQLYCPDNAVTRSQMAVFLLKTHLGHLYVPPACTGTVFADVPCAGGAFDPWIEDLAARGITGGCGGGNYCPGNPNNRGQMAVFLVKMFELTLYRP